MKFTFRFIFGLIVSAFFLASFLPVETFAAPKASSAKKEESSVKGEKSNGKVVSKKNTRPAPPLKQSASNKNVVCKKNSCKQQQIAKRTKVSARRGKPAKASRTKVYRSRGADPAPIPVYTGINSLASVEHGRSYRINKNGEKLFLTASPYLQEQAERILAHYRVPWGAIVAIEPKSGKVLAIAGHSEIDPQGINLTTRASFPAASLFKVITAAAAVEKSGLNGDTTIHYRGGDYTLNRSNYNPDSQRDHRRIDLAKALGKSCNPAFARVALNELSVPLLQRYAQNFGFDRRIPFDAPLEQSSFAVPKDSYEFARTAAGFGEVLLSPLHAAMIAASLGNDGVMMQPYLIDHITDKRGKIKYSAEPTVLQRTVRSSTAGQVLKMMESTVEEGTARKYFSRTTNRKLREMRIAGKTGTLSGQNPKGVYHWFIAVAPVEDPQLAVATLVIDPGTARIGGTGLGRYFMEYFFSEDALQQVVQADDKRKQG